MTPDPRAIVLPGQRAVRGEVLPEVTITLERRGGLWDVIDCQTKMTLSRRGRALRGTFQEADAAARWLEREYQFTYKRVQGLLAP